MLKIDIPTSTSRPTWTTRETFIREQVQTCLQRVLEEEVDDLLGRDHHARRSVDTAVGHRNGFGKPRQVALMNGTITLRRPRVRGLDARFESRILVGHRRGAGTAALPPRLSAPLPEGVRTPRSRLSAHARVLSVSERALAPSAYHQRRRIALCGGAAAHQCGEAPQEIRTRDRHHLAAAARGRKPLSQAQRAGAVPRCVSRRPLRGWPRGTRCVIHPKGRRLTRIYTLLDETSDLVMDCV